MTPPVLPAPPGRAAPRTSRCWCYAAGVRPVRGARRRRRRTPPAGPPRRSDRRRRPRVSATGSRARPCSRPCSALSSRSAIRPSILPPTSGMPTLMSRSTRLGGACRRTRRAGRCRSSRRACRGSSTCDAAPASSTSSVSRWTMLISSPTNFFANDGMPVGRLDLVDRRPPCRRRRRSTVTSCAQHALVVADLLAEGRVGQHRGDRVGRGVVRRSCVESLRHSVLSLQPGRHRRRARRRCPARILSASELLELAADQRHLDLDVELDDLDGVAAARRPSVTVPSTPDGLPGVSMLQRAAGRVRPLLGAGSPGSTRRRSCWRTTAGRRCGWTWSTTSEKPVAGRARA